MRCLLIILLDRVLVDSYFVSSLPVLQLLDYSYSWKMRKKRNPLGAAPTLAVIA